MHCRLAVYLRVKMNAIVSTGAIKVVVVSSPELARWCWISHSDVFTWPADPCQHQERQKRQELHRMPDPLSQQNLVVYSRRRSACCTRCEATQLLCAAVPLRAFTPAHWVLDLELLHAQKIGRFKQFQAALCCLCAACTCLADLDATCLTNEPQLGTLLLSSHMWFS